MNSQNGSTQTSIRGGRSGLKYLLVGGGIGAVVALLFAPKAGAEFRTGIADATKRGYDSSLDLARKLKDQSTDLYHSFVEGDGTDEMRGRASNTLPVATDAAGEMADDASSAADDLLSIEDSSTGGNFGRNSTNIV